MRMVPRSGATHFLGRSVSSNANKSGVSYPTTSPPVDVPSEDVALAFKNGWGPVFGSNGVPVT